MRSCAEWAERILYDLNRSEPDGRTHHHAAKHPCDPERAPSERETGQGCVDEESRQSDWDSWIYLSPGAGEERLTPSPTSGNASPDQAGVSQIDSQRRGKQEQDAGGVEESGGMGHVRMLLGRSETPK